MFRTNDGQTFAPNHSTVMCRGWDCVLHNPSDHAMRDWPTQYNLEYDTIERLCEHGIAHPDPDNFMLDGYDHVCDECCVNL